MAATVEQLSQMMQQEQLQLVRHLPQQQQPARTPEQTVQKSASEKQQLNARGFENMAVFTEGEENWQTWLWKVRTAVSGMYGDSAEVMKADHKQRGATCI